MRFIAEIFISEPCLVKSACASTAEIAAGNPARVIREITDEDKHYYFKKRRFDVDDYLIPDTIDWSKI